MHLFRQSTVPLRRGPGLCFALFLAAVDGVDEAIDIGKMLKH